MTAYSVVGTSVTRKDALEKVTGQAKYTTDIDLHLPNLLHGRILHSPYPHARILSIDTSRAEKLPGVRAVLTGKDVPSVRFGGCVADRQLLCQDRVRFIGDFVATVAAESREAADEALELIEVEYQELPAIFDPEEAMKPDCPVVIHPDLPTYARPYLSYLGRDLPGPNVHSHHKIRRGDVEDGFRKADLIVESRFSTPMVAHCQIEPYNAYAYRDDGGILTIWSPIHSLFSATQDVVCTVFSLPPSKVRVRASHMGGNFGAQPQAEPIAALLAMKTGKPVRVGFSREECFFAGLNQQPMITYIKDGVSGDGTLLAREIKVISDSGPTGTYAPFVGRNGSYTLSLYRVPNLKWDSYGVYTNGPCAGPFRGFGVPQIHWAIEQQMDLIARKLGIDAVEMRERNLLMEREENVRGEVIAGTGARGCLDGVAKWIGWHEGRTQASGNKRTGKGIALCIKHSLGNSYSAARVKVLGDGTVELIHGGDEVGQGANTILAQIAAEEFNTSMDKVKVYWGDTASTPYDFGALSSRTTFNMGNAVRIACEDAKRQIFELAAVRLECSPKDLEISSGCVSVKGSPEKRIGLSQLFPVYVSGYLSERGEILGKGAYIKRGSLEDPETGQGKELSMFYTYGAQAVEVSVDTETGQVVLLRLGAAFDMGQPINPKLCEVQIEGGVAMGIGGALFEQVLVDKGGVANPNFTDYRVPGAAQVPSGDKFASMLLWVPQDDGPFKAKGLGEATMGPTAPAIANAIYDAVGVRIADSPITPEKVLKALREKEHGNQNQG